ncbi:MAG: hypothetical protein ABNH42_19755 [Marinobacter sp.]|jgi:hypothetical protein
MPEQVTGDDRSWLDSLGDFLGDKVNAATDLGLEIIRAERIPGDNASANPTTSPKVTTGSQPTGEPVWLSAEGIRQNWPMMVAMLVVVVALVLLIGRLL